jgi:hypothetical protein
MTLPTGLSRRELLMKLAMKPGFLSAISINFLPEKHAWRRIEIL